MSVAHIWGGRGGDDPHNTKFRGEAINRSSKTFPYIANELYDLSKWHYKYREVACKHVFSLLHNVLCAVAFLHNTATPAPTR